MIFVKCLRIATMAAAWYLGVRAAQAQTWPSNAWVEPPAVELAQSTMPPYVPQIEGPQGGPGSRACPEFADAKPVWASKSFDADALNQVDTTTDRALQAWNTPAFAMEEENLKDLLAHSQPKAFSAMEWQLHFQCDNPAVPTGALTAVWAGVSGNAVSAPPDDGMGAPPGERPMGETNQQNNTTNQPWVEQ